MAAKKRESAARVQAQKKPRDIHDALMLACIFLGLGVGVAFGQAGAGLLIGAGVGILARGYSKYGSNKQTVMTSLGTAGYIVALIGIYFIFLGLSLFYGVVWLYPYAASVPLIIIGLFLLIIFFRQRTA